MKDISLFFVFGLMFIYLFVYIVLIRMTCTGRLHFPFKIWSTKNMGDYERAVAANDVISFWPITLPIIAGIKSVQWLTGKWKN